MLNRRWEMSWVHTVEEVKGGQIKFKPRSEKGTVNLVSMLPDWGLGGLLSFVSILAIEGQMLLELTVSPRCPGWPGSPSFPGGPCSAKIDHSFSYSICWKTKASDLCRFFRAVESEFCLSTYRGTLWSREAHWSLRPLRTLQWQRDTIITMQEDNRNKSGNMKYPVVTCPET